jgi:DNA-binding transcriptional LysR family regulator
LGVHAKWLLLEEFVTYCKYMNLTKTARELHSSQATISRHLTALKNELGSQLFIYDEKSHRHELTEAGAIALEESGRILNIVTEMKERIDSLNSTDASREISVAYQYPIDQTATDALSLAEHVFRKLHGPIAISGIWITTLTAFLCRSGWVSKWS